MILRCTQGLYLLALAVSAMANPVGDQVAAMTEAQRQMFFARLLQREGERCPAVTRTFLQGSASDGAMFWSIACRGAAEWQVMIKNTPGGAGGILECSVIKAINAGRCFTKFK